MIDFKKVLQDRQARYRAERLEIDAKLNAVGLTRDERKQLELKRFYLFAAMEENAKLLAELKV